MATKTTTRRQVKLCPIKAAKAGIVRGKATSVETWASKLVELPKCRAWASKYVQDESTNVDNND
jgi:hypothetical protein